MSSDEHLHQLVLDCDALLSRFDKAVDKSQIIYLPTTPIPITDCGFKFEVRICPQFAQKPQLPTEDVRPTGSDIGRPPALEISEVRPAHHLIFNAYPVLRPSYLLLTSDPLQIQSSPLSLADFVAARTTLARLSRGHAKGGAAGKNDDWKYVMAYNCGRAAGCSRNHKHMQIFPSPSPGASSFSIFPDQGQPADVPFVYDLIQHDDRIVIPHVLPGADINSEKLALGLFEWYRSSLDRFRDDFGWKGKTQCIPHNVVMTQDWTVVVPRRRAEVGGLSTNAVGMMGMVWVKTEDEVERWKKAGLSSILAELGMESDDSPSQKNKPRLR
ncbi:MAG: hypothetical protein M1814_003291 [Vezdaea aestivalis]|nr:MAG: hypothetical protein M1814_003291 [Vezdaea aestivalis]